MSSIESFSAKPRPPCTSRKTADWTESVGGTIQTIPSTRDRIQSPCIMYDPSENGLYGMSGYEQIEDESFPPLPPPLSPGEGNFDEEPAAIGEGEDGELSKLPDVPVAKRRTVKRPQPKLDSHRLISERGLPALRTLFTDVKFKGKGHEAEDLKVLMQKMENWAHRLYPKLQFEDFIQKLESLGGKKDVQTCLKRIRLDMPLTHEDFIGNGDGGDEAEVDLQEDVDVFENQSFSEDPFLHSTPALAPLSLTEEQQQRIERNKQLALERKLARQKQLESSQSASPGEPVASPTAPRLSRDDQKEPDQTTENTDTPSKQDPVASPSSSQYNRCDSPVPEMTNDTDNE